jgi:hypothetical protein|tara:strand:- start:3652 stop:4854 length:1203 start_codon:yes stop_codon:yes gene_type:complete
MGLIQETNLQYYAGTQLFTQNNNTTTFQSTFNTDLIIQSDNPAAQVYPLNNVDLKISVDAGATWTAYNTNVNPLFTYNLRIGNIVNVPNGIPAGTWLMLQLRTAAVDNNYGGYEYIKVSDIVNNYLMAYVGQDKLIPNIKRTDVVFHAKRGLQEFSYDTLKSVKALELQIPPSLSLIIPQDYVNYVRFSYIDAIGVKHIIYPANNLTINPKALTQDSLGEPIQDSNGNNTQVPDTTTELWSKANTRLITGLWQEYPVGSAFNTNTFPQSYYPDWWVEQLGQRYGMDPATTQKNGWFTINEVNGTFNFSSNLANQLIVIEYISDGLASDLDTRVPKMAEDAMYAHINHAVLGSRINVPEYIVQRYKRERSAKLRNAKIRLSNIKLDEITQVMRGKSKWLKN